MHTGVLPDGPVLAGRYRVRLLLHRSASSRTWDAFDPVLDRAVTVETLDPRCGPQARAAFRSAALQSAQCSHHGLIAVYDTGDDRGTAFVVTERIVGTPLDTVLTTNGPLELTDAASIISEAADALAAAHSQGLVHGALRSSSIVVQPNSRVKIGGFGAPATNDRYCAPERRSGGPPTPGSDLYALAVCAVETLAGEPFDPGLYPVEAVLRDRSDVPRSVVVALTRALDPDPVARAAHIRALARAFAPVAAQGIDAAPAYAIPEAPTQPNAPVTRTVPVVANPLPATTPSAAELAAAAEPFHPRREPHVTRRLMVLLIGLLALSGLVGLGVLLAITDPSGMLVPETATPSTSPIPVGTVTDFDPFGDNGREGASTIARAADGNPATAWSTEIYTTPNFGNGKPGLGVIVEPQTRRAVRSVTIATLEPGWSAQIFTRATPASDLAGWGSPVAEVKDADRAETITLPSSATGGSVLIWFTRLPDQGRLNVAEIQLLG